MIQGSMLVPLSALEESHVKWLVAKQTMNEYGERLEESTLVALYGGYVLAVDAQPIFIPQCCSTLAAIHGWADVLRPCSVSGFVGEGHPALQWNIRNDLIVLEWDIETEPFEPPTFPRTKSLQVESVRHGVRRALWEVELFARELSALPIASEFVNLANALVWRDENGSDYTSIDGLIQSTRDATDTTS
ncbi:MAG: hypothetical protein QM784_28130 [Polyangiaceae bacterium]